MDIIALAKAALIALKDLSWEERSEGFKKLPEEVQEAYSKLQMDEYFAPEKAGHDKAKEHLSPSGKYRLVVTPFETKPGCWSYSQGLVYAVGSDTPLFEVRRNYHSFPKSWVEGHPNGHDYLVCGANYQGQTVLELDTGNRRDFIPESAKQGHGFCWTGHEFKTESQILVVDGCYWACPYEYKFFDFSDPMSGWPELEVDSYVDFDNEAPTFNADGTITCYQSEYEEDDEDDDDPEDEKAAKKVNQLASTKTFKRDGAKLVLVNEWVSEKEQRKRVSREEASRKYDEWVANFRATDPLYLTMKECLTDSALSPSGYDSVGTAYAGWCPDFQVQERRFCRRIVNKDPGIYTIDLEWAVETGPIKLVIYKNGSKHEDKFFMEHSADSMRAAFTYAKSLLGT